MFLGALAQADSSHPWSVEVSTSVLARVAVRMRCGLEGRRFGLDHLSVILGETAPGRGIALHRHEYEEIFIIHAGKGTYNVGDDVLEAAAGEVVMVPSGMPHRCVNNGNVPLQHTGWIKRWRGEQGL